MTPPPGSNPSPAEPAPDIDDIPTKEELAARSASFRWPPITPPTSPVPLPTPPRHAPTPFPPLSPPPAHLPTSSYLSSWSAFERVWLGLVAPPLRQRMAHLGWAPDTPDRYCPRCAATVGPHESTPAGCPLCTAKRLPWVRAIRLGEYRPPLSLFVQEVKFTRWRRLGRELGTLLAESLSPALEEAGRDPEHLVVLPVPTTFRRRMTRGIDHTLVLARGTARSLGVPVRQPLRRAHRPSQLDVPPSQRSSNMAGAFSAVRPKALARAAAAGQAGTIVVIDDVTTTGATLRGTAAAVAKSLRSLPVGKRPQIWIAVLAYTPPAGGPRREALDAPTDAERTTMPGSAWT